jgi:hypothetical protein
VSDVQDVFLKFEKAESVEFECLNFRLQNIADIIKNIVDVEPSLKERYERMLKERAFYSQCWQEIKKDIEMQAKDAKKRYNMHMHSFGDYFNNTYSY